jgi:hypothetical protein
MTSPSHAARLHLSVHSNCPLHMSSSESQVKAYALGHKSGCRYEWDSGNDVWNVDYGAMPDAGQPTFDTSHNTYYIRCATALYSTALA